MPVDGGSRVDVVNPYGRDAPVDYRAGVTHPDAPIHPPINYWAFAAATGGRFHRDPAAVGEPVRAVLVLIRQRVGVSLAAVRALKRAGHTVYVSWKESGARQIEGQLRWFWHRRALTRLLAEADGAIAVTRFAAGHYRGKGGDRHGKIPFGDVDGVWGRQEHDRQPVAERRGILVGTRELDVPGRRHEDAIRLAADCARATGAPVTVMNFDGPRARARIEAALGGVPGARILEQRLPYVGYLREMARHRVVLQLDESGVPGQVAGDALLCRTIAAGGNGAIQEVAFNPWAHGDAARLKTEVVRLLTEDAYYERGVRDSQAVAMDKLSFAAARRALASIKPRRATG
jgi:hypothetical protein